MLRVGSPGLWRLREVTWSLRDVGRSVLKEGMPELGLQESAEVGNRSLKTWGGGSDAEIAGWGGAGPGMESKAWCRLLAGFSSGKAAMGSGPWT